jgi:O-antigen ligase
MLKAKWLQPLPGYMLCLLAFTIPLPFIYAALSIVLLAIVWLLQADFKITYQNLKTHKILWIWIAYFLMLSISYTYSNNKEQSLFDLQTKLSILVLPIIIGCGMQLDKRLLEKIFFFFTVGITLTALFCISKGLWLWHSTGETKFLFYHDLVEGFEANAVYMAWYVLFSITLLLFVPWSNFFQNEYKALKIIFLLVQTIFFVLLSARMLIAVFFLILIPYYLRLIMVKQRVKLWQSIVVAVIVLLLGLVLLTTHNPIRKRYADISHNNIDSVFKGNYHNFKETKFNNLTLRMFLWRICIENMNEHHLWLKGAGNGDAQALQNAKIAEYHIISFDDDRSKAAIVNANLHNMFMQSLIMVGIPGALLFSILCMVPLFYIRKVDYAQVFLIFHITAIAFMFQEAALQTQAGVIYYSFFSMIFWNLYYRKRSSLSDL